MKIQQVEKIIKNEVWDHQKKICDVIVKMKQTLRTTLDTMFNKFTAMLENVSNQVVNNRNKQTDRLYPIRVENVQTE